MRFERPERRWKQYGSKAELLALVKAHGLRNLDGPTRKRAVHQLWTAGLLPGSVRRDHDRDQCEACQSAA